MARPRRNPLQLVFMLPRFYAGLMYFVDSTYGSNDQLGTDQNRPLRSITYAMTKCVDDHDDVIVVLNGYDNDLTDTETNGDDTPIILNKNGVTVLFSGKNNNVQAIGSADSIFQIDCNQGTIGIVGELDMSIGGGTSQSAIFVKAAKAGTEATIVEIKAAAVDAEVYGFKTSDLDGYDELFTVNATAHRADIHHVHMIGDATDTDEGVVISGTNQGTRVHHSSFYTCALGTAGIEIAGAAVLLEIDHNILYHLAASKYGVKADASATGIVHDNYIKCNDSHVAKGIVGTIMIFYENYNPTDASKSGLILPAIS